MSVNLLSNLSWVRRAIAVGAAGFTLSSTLAAWLLPGRTITIAENGGAAILLWAAFFWAARQPRRAMLFGIAVVMSELVAVVFREGDVDPTIPLLFPVLALTAGLLYGARATATVAGLAIGAVAVAALAGRRLLHLPALVPAEVFDLAVVELEIAGGVYFGWIVLSAYKELLVETEESRQRYHQLFEHAPDGLVEVDGDTHILEANPAALRMLGLSAASSMGRRLQDMVQFSGSAPAQDLARLQPGQLRTVDIGQGHGVRHLEIAARAQPGPDGRLLLVVRDATVRRTAEGRREQTRRLETVGRLAGGIAHDLNNMLTAVGGNAELLKDPEVRDVPRLAEEILAAQRRAAGLIRRLMSFAQHDFRQAEVFDLAAAVRDWREPLQEQATGKCRIELGGDGRALVEADEMQIQRVLLNLVENARDASSAGQVVEVLVRRMGGAEAARSGSSLRAERQVVIEVVDYGAGMGPEIKTRLFEPFFTTKPQGQATGLGLAEVHGLVAQNRGAVEVKTAPGHGTTVRIFLPEAAGDKGLA